MPLLKNQRFYFRTLPRGIWTLGFVSLFTDASSDLVRSLLPMFMVTVFGASMTMVGLIEGTAEAAALIIKVFSGILSDIIGRRKWLAVSGYAISAFAKILFPLATTISSVFSARLLDRIGKGVRDAPRDALVSEIAPARLRGASFGLRQSLDTVGAFIGPLLAIGLMFLFSNNIYSVLWIAVIPGFISVAIFIFRVKEPIRVQHNSKLAHLRLQDARHLNIAYWKLVGIGLILTLARFSQAFLLLKAQSSGLAIAMVPVIMIVMNIVYALAGYPAGVFSDYVNRKSILLIGICFLILGDTVLGLSNSLWGVFIGTIFWGLHMGFSEGILAAMITDTVDVKLRGTAYGMYNFVCGLGTLASSLTAGILWDSFGSKFTFLAGVFFSLLAFGAILFEIKNTQNSVHKRKNL